MSIQSTHYISRDSAISRINEVLNICHELDYQGLEDKDDYINKINECFKLTLS